MIRFEARDFTLIQILFRRSLAIAPEFFIFSQGILALFHIIISGCVDF